ncbi:MerR family transcriptional regulator [Tumebacillus sp. ITR2]|uniref:MerR family transcriptional regulator n=1 Tax=Tumebacillus amylolyticus TaxID=2801339 RepID=A0ABS1J5T5_9BACL|nr:MerR family transcriptional regulator [Tumebacillus amylolyticus]MBL0385643.1 MerR family transcriptional regulator [Tumebacillus amylolyticus]
MSIKQAAERTGLSEDTIRYYEKIDLLPPAKRNSGGRRVYGADDLELMVFITHLKSAGMSLETIKYYLSLSLEEDPNAASERLALLTEQKKLVESKLAELQAVYKVLEHKVEHYTEVCLPEKLRLKKETVPK